YDLVLNGRATQRLFKHTRLGMGAVKNSTLIGNRPLGKCPLDAPRHKGRLDALIRTGPHDDRIARLLIRPQLFGLTIAGWGNHPQGRLNDALCGTIGLFRLGDFRRRQVVLKTPDDAYVCSAPAVDTLIVVTDDTQVSTSGGQGPHNSILYQVGVLKLVHQYVLKLAPYLDDCMACLVFNNLLDEQTQGS